jgi:hypothetical protein
VDAFRRLPPETATELSALAERLAELAPNKRIDWSDSWSDEDLNEFRGASLRLALVKLHFHLPIQYSGQTNDIK